MPFINATIAHQLTNPVTPPLSLVLAVDFTMKYPEDFNTWIISVSDAALAGHTINVTRGATNAFITSFVLNGSGVGSVTVYNELNVPASSYLSYSGNYTSYEAVFPGLYPIILKSASDISYSSTFNVPPDAPYGHLGISNLNPHVGDTVFFKGYHPYYITSSSGGVTTVAEDLSTYVSSVDLFVSGGNPANAGVTSGTNIYYGPGTAGSHEIVYAFGQAYSKYPYGLYVFYDPAHYADYYSYGESYTVTVSANTAEFSWQPHRNTIYKTYVPYITGDTVRIAGSFFPGAIGPVMKIYVNNVLMFQNENTTTAPHVTNGMIDLNTGGVVGHGRFNISFKPATYGASWTIGNAGVIEIAFDTTPPS